MHPDEAVVHAVLAGDRDTYSELVERYSEPTHALAYSYLRDAQAAEDVAQEAFIRAYTSLRTLAAPKLFGAWLAQITRNLCRAALRSRPLPVRPSTQVADIPAPATPDASGREEQRHVRAVLDEAILKLSPKLRETVVLFYFRQQSLHEIASYLGVSENTVKQRLHRARGLLREHLDQTISEELAASRPSQRFTIAVMSALPSKPAEIGGLTAGFAKLVSYALAAPFLATIAMVVLVTAVMNLTIVAGVSKPYRPAYRKVLRSAWYFVLPIALLSAGSVALSRDHPWLAMGLMLLPGLLIMWTWPSMRILNWRFRFGIMAALAALILLSLQLLYPYLEELSFWMKISAMAVLWCIQPVVTAMLPARRADELPPADIPPVGMDYLRRHAYRFARALNTPFPHITRMWINEDSVRLANPVPRMFAWAPKQGYVEFDIRFYPDGRAHVDLVNVPASSMIVSPDECRTRLQAWVQRKWAYYVTGQKRAARAVKLNLQPADFYKNRKGPRIVRYMTPVCLVLLAVSLGLKFYHREPALTESRLRHFYKTEFLDRYRNGFTEFPLHSPHVPLSSRQPPSMMNVPGVAEAYIDFQKRWVTSSSPRYVVLRARELVFGLEAGYLTVPMLQSWGLTRENLTPPPGVHPFLTTLTPGVDNSDRPLDHADLSSLAETVRLLKALGLLDLVDPHVPEKVVKRVQYRDGAFRERVNGDLFELQTTCYVACLLHHFGRWDLADWKAVRRWLVNWPRKGIRYDPEQVYWLGVGLVVTGGVEDFSLRAAARMHRPVISVFSEHGPWSIALHDINAYAIVDILRSGTLLELRYK